MKRYDLKEEKGSFVLLELRPVPVATFAERALAEMVLDLLEEAAEDDETLGPRTKPVKKLVVPPTVIATVGGAARAMTREQFEMWGAALSGRAEEITSKPNDHEDSKPVETAEEITPPPPMTEAVVIVPADHETETGAAPEGEAPGGEPGDALPAEALTTHGHAAPAEAEAAEAGASAPPADEPPSWEALHARGLTAREAAEARDCGVGAAYVWSSKNGVKWAPATPAAPDPAAQPAPAPRPAADLKGWTQEDLEAALLQVEGGGKVEAVADEYGAPAHVLRSHWMKRLAAKREAAGLPLRTNGATAREDAEAGR